MCDEDPIVVFNSFATAIHNLLYVIQQKVFKMHTVFGIMQNLANFQSSITLSDAITELFTPDFKMFQLKQLAQSFKNVQFLKDVFHLKHRLLIMEFVTVPSLLQQQQQQQQHKQPPLLMPHNVGVDGAENTAEIKGDLIVCDRELIIKCARSLRINPVNYLMAMSNGNSGKKIDFNLEHSMTLFSSEISQYKDAPFQPNFKFTDDASSTDNNSAGAVYIHHNETAKCINSSTQIEMLLFTELAFRKTFNVQNYIATISQNSTAGSAATFSSDSSSSNNNNKRFKNNYG